MDINTLNNFNPWWTQKKVPEALLKEHRRPQLAVLKKYLDKRFIMLLYGLRQVGKTTLLYQLIDILLKKNDPFSILYFSFDDRTATIEDLLKFYEEKVLKKKISDAEKTYLVFDEIQKLPNWQEKIKILYDTHPNAKILLSGSASILLQKPAKESLAGRIIDFQVKPLTFCEFLAWRKIPVDFKHPEIYQDTAIPAFMDFLRKGGFPAIIDEQDDEFIRQYLKDTVLERIIFRDLVSEFRIKDIELLRLLVEMVAREPGMIVNFDRLARDLGRTKITISNYFNYLAYALITREVRNLRAGFLVSSRKAKKVYPTSPAFCFAYMDDFYAERQLEKIAELVVAETLGAQFYYRDGFEVDFILKSGQKVIPVEVKYGQPETRQIKQFLEKFSLEKGVVVSKDKFSVSKGIKTVPLWYFAATYPSRRQLFLS